MSEPRPSDEDIKRFAQKAIDNQYTATGKPIEPYPPKRKVQAKAKGDEVGEKLRKLDKKCEDIKNLIWHETVMLNDVDRMQWESTKELYALGRKNVIKAISRVGVLALLGMVVGAVGLVTAIKAYQK